MRSLIFVLLLMFSLPAAAEDHPFLEMSQPKEEGGAEEDIVVEPFDKEAGGRIVIKNEVGKYMCLVPGDDYQLGTCPAGVRCVYAVFVECPPE